MNSYQKIKLALTAVFVFGSLLIFWRFSGNGRYHLSDSGYFVIDSWTGDVYRSKEKMKDEKEIEVIL